MAGLPVDHPQAQTPGSLPLVGVGLVSLPLCPSISGSVLSLSWLALPHLSLSRLRFPKSPFLQKPPPPAQTGSQPLEDLASPFPVEGGGGREG